MINFKKIIISLISVNFILFIWWLILVFNTIPKKFYLLDSNFQTESSAIIVLTGGKGRIKKGIDLLNNNYGSYLFVSGIFKESELKIKDVINKQLEHEDCCVFFDNNAKNTIENAYEVKKWLTDFSEIENIILVSSYYHLPRSYLIFNTIIKNKEIKLFPADYKIKLNNELLFHLKLLALEYFKVIYTIFVV